MKQLLVPIVLISLVFALGLGYYVINQKMPGGNPLKYGESLSPTSTTGVPSDAAGVMEKSATPDITPTVTATEVNIDDLDTTINSIDLTGLNDSMSDLQTE